MFLESWWALILFMTLLGLALCIPIYVAISANRQLFYLFSKICSRYTIDAQGSVWTSNLEATGEWNGVRVDLRSERYQGTSKRSGVRLIISFIPSDTSKQSLENNIVFDTVNQYKGVFLKEVDEQWSTLVSLLSEMEKAIFVSHD